MVNFQIEPSVEPFNVPLRELRALHLNKRLVVGVALLQTSPSTQDDNHLQRKILLLQRHADEDAFPLMYEIPGGCAEDEDDTILVTVCREVAEETGLIVSRAIGAFEGFEYSTKKGATIQLNFLAEVEGSDVRVEVRLNPGEHQAFVWVEEGDTLENYPMTDSMRKTVSDAFNKLVEVS